LNAHPAVIHPKIMLAKRFEELKATGALPSPTGVGLEILRLARDDNASAADIARLIQADPALTGRTLRLANTGNSAASRPVTNIADSVARLGTRTVSAVALGFTIVAGNRSGKCRGFDYQRHWAYSLAQSVATQVLASQTRTYDGADGFAAGLLAQIGRLGLASIHPEQYATVLVEWARGSADDLLRLEQKAFVTNHNELSAAMIADWGLPKTVCDAVLCQEDPEASDLPLGSQSRQLALILRAAARIADVCVAPSDSHAAVFAPDVLNRCEAVGLESGAAHALFDRVFFQWAEWGRVLDISTAKSRKLSRLIEAYPASSLPTTPAAAPPQAVPAFPVPQSLPTSATAPEKAAEQLELEVDESSSELLVLLADSDIASLRFLEKFLVLSGYHVRCASGGHEALQTFFETAPQLVIINSAMPEISGLEFCRRVRQTTAGRQAYIILLTEVGDEETLVRLFEAGADDFITKPFPLGHSLPGSVPASAWSICRTASVGTEMKSSGLVPSWPSLDADSSRTPSPMC
jgi:HD-like signal output (HDOD) protein